MHRVRMACERSGSTSSRPRRHLLTRTQAGGLLLAILNVMGYYTRFAAGECDDGGVS